MNNLSLVLNWIKQLFNNDRHSTQWIDVDEENNDKKFWDEFLVSLPDISPDAMVHVDWLFLMRSKCNLDTYAAVYKFPNDKESVVMSDMIEVLPSVSGCSSERTYASAGLVRKYYLKNGVLELCVILTRNDEYCSISAIGDRELVEYMSEEFRKAYTIPNKISITKLIGFSDQGPITHTEDVVDTDDDVALANNDFYPFLNEGAGIDIDQVAKDFKASTANIMVLIGPPGTGKTTFLRSLIFKMKMDDNIVVIGDNTILHPGFTTFLHKVRQNSFISIEDADELCRPRETVGNSQMASILNFADGVVNNGAKLVIATNLTSVSKVDEALIRDGRAFKENRDRWLEVLNMEKVAIACYCHRGHFCHRYLLVEMFEKVAKHLKIEFEYKGEIY